MTIVVEPLTGAAVVVVAGVLAERGGVTCARVPSAIGIVEEAMVVVWK